MLHCSYIYSCLLARLIVAQTLCLACSSEIFFFSKHSSRCLDSLERFTFPVFTCSPALVELHCGKVEKLLASLAQATSKD